MTWNSLVKLSKPPSFWLLMSVFILGSTVRLIVAFQDKLWLDELHTGWTVDGDFSLVFSRASAGNQSPVFFWMVWPIKRLAEILNLDPASPIPIRMLSMFAGCGSIMLTGYLVWKWTDSWMAAFAALWLASLDTSLIFYSTEARPYALMQFLTLVQGSIFWKWLREFVGERADAQVTHASRRRYLLSLQLAIASSLLISIHLSGGWLILAEVCYVAIRFCLSAGLQNSTSKNQGVDARIFSFAGWVGSLMLILMFPLAPYIRELWVGRSNWNSISDWALMLSDLNLQLRWGCLMPLLLMLVLRMGFGKPWKLRTADSESSLVAELRGNLLFVSWWIGLPIIGICLLDANQLIPLAHVRYVQVSMIAVPVFAGICVGAVSSGWPRLTILVAIVLGSCVPNIWLSSAISEGQLPRFRSEDWEILIREISRNKNPIFLFANILEDRDALDRENQRLQNYLQFPLRAIPKLETENKVLSYPTLYRKVFLDSDLDHVVEQRGAWFIIRADESLANEILAQFLDQLRLHRRTQIDARWTIRRAIFDSPWNDVKLYRIVP